MLRHTAARPVNTVFKCRYVRYSLVNVLYPTNKDEFRNMAQTVEPTRQLRTNRSQELE